MVTLSGCGGGAGQREVPAAQADAGHTHRLNGGVQAELLGSGELLVSFEQERNGAVTCAQACFRKIHPVPPIFVNVNQTQEEQMSDGDVSSQRYTVGSCTHFPCFHLGTFSGHK